MRKPYKNICPHCVFLGQDHKYDIYWCKEIPKDIVNLILIYKNHKKGGLYNHLLGEAHWLTPQEYKFRAKKLLKISEDRWLNLYIKGLTLATQQGYIDLFRNLNYD